MRDLKTTLIKGALQLTGFREDLIAKCAGLDDLSGIREIQLLQVTHDELAWANWMLRDAIAREVPAAFNVHICSIGDLENMQRYCWGKSLHAMLASKTGGDSSSHDFREWLAERGKPPGAHPMLATVYQELAASWGAGLLTAQRVTS
jgi:hypothetical protein